MSDMYSHYIVFHWIAQNQSDETKAALATKFADLFHTEGNSLKFNDSIIFIADQIPNATSHRSRFANLSKSERNQKFIKLIKDILKNILLAPFSQNEAASQLAYILFKQCNQTGSANLDTLTKLYKSLVDKVKLSEQTESFDTAAFETSCNTLLTLIKFTEESYAKTRMNFTTFVTHPFGLIYLLGIIIYIAVGIAQANLSMLALAPAALGYMGVRSTNLVKSELASLQLSTTIAFDKRQNDASEFFQSTVNNCLALKSASEAEAEADETKNDAQIPTVDIEHKVNQVSELKLSGSHSLPNLTHHVVSSPIRSSTSLCSIQPSPLPSADLLTATSESSSSNDVSLWNDVSPSHDTVEYSDTDSSDDTYYEFKQYQKQKSKINDANEQEDNLSTQAKVLAALKPYYPRDFKEKHVIETNNGWGILDKECMPGKLDKTVIRSLKGTMTSSAGRDLLGAKNTGKNGVKMPGKNKTKTDKLRHDYTCPLTKEKNRLTHSILKHRSTIWRIAGSEYAQYDGKPIVVYNHPVPK